MSIITPRLYAQRTPGPRELEVNGEHVAYGSENRGRALWEIARQLAAANDIADARRFEPLEIVMGDSYITTRPYREPD